MSSRNARPVAVSALVLWIVLAPSAALASPRTPGEEDGAWLARLWSGLSSLWSKDGCQILPDGRPYCPSRETPVLSPNGPGHEAVSKAAPANAAPASPDASEATRATGREPSDADAKSRR